MPIGWTNAGSGSGGGSLSLDDVSVLVCDFSTFSNVTVVEGNKDSNGRQVTA